MNIFLRTPDINKTEKVRVRLPNLFKFIKKYIQIYNSNLTLCFL
jgi:hypothetical protein